MADALLLVGEPKEEGSLKELSRGATFIVHSADEAQQAFSRWKSALWVVLTGETLDDLFRIVGPTKGDKNLIVFGPIEEFRLDVLRTLFRNVISTRKDLTLLPQDELAEILLDKDRANYIVAGSVDRDRQRLILYRGNLEAIVVPWSWFGETTSRETPDFEQFSVTDFGQTVKLGKYEASVDAILYAFDPDYRKIARKLAIDQDSSFGGCLRRLRLFKGLPREAFSGIVSPKELGRIERGEVAPRKQTIDRIAARLNVQPEEIESF